MRSYVAVIGSSRASAGEYETARQAGRILAERGIVVVNGGLGGVMQAAAEGVAEGGGISIGLLPGLDRDEANSSLTVSLPTGIGELRNGLVVRSADVVLAVGGSWGTLSEIALAVRTGVPVVAIGGWELPAPGVITARDVEAALEVVIGLLAKLPDAG